MGSTAVSDVNINLHVYHHFKSIWKEVDNDNITKLANHSQLSTRINQKEQGVTPLFLACQRKNFPMIHFLLQAGADPNIECKGVTPLYLCCLYGEEESVEVLLTHGANHSALCTSRRIAPLHLAASKGILNMAQMLVKAGADINILSPKYGTPLHVAVSKNHQYIMRFLLSNGAQAGVNIAKEDGDTPLHVACRLGIIPIVKTLIELPNINVSLKESTEGNTCLHLACLHNRETIALMLISKFPDLVYVKNNIDRQTPLFYAGDSVRKAIKRAFTNQTPGLPNAVNNKTFSDIRIHVAHNQTLYAHKIILYCRCPAILNTHPDQNSLTFHDIEAPVFIALLHYLYTDLLHCEKVYLSKLIQAADRFGLVRLKKLCIDANTTDFFVAIPESTFKQDMKNAVNESKFSDVTFIVEGKPLYAHRVALAHHEYFKLMFGSQLRESSQKEIALHDIGSYQVFTVLMQYCYTFDVKIDQSKDPSGAILVELFQSANMFMLDGLRHSCEAALCAYINKESVCEIFQLAETFKSLFLKEECFDFLVLYFDELCETEEFKHMQQDLQDEVTEYVVKKQTHFGRIIPKPTTDKNYSLL